MKENYLRSNIAFLLRKHNVNMTRAAKAMGISHASIHNILQGRIAQPHSETAEKIAEYFDMSVDELFGTDLASTEPNNIFEIEVPLCYFVGKEKVSVIEFLDLAIKLVTEDAFIAGQNTKGKQQQK